MIFVTQTQPVSALPLRFLSAYRHCKHACCLIFSTQARVHCCSGSTLPFGGILPLSAMSDDKKLFSHRSLPLFLFFLSFFLAVLFSVSLFISPILAHSLYVRHCFPLMSLSRTHTLALSPLNNYLSVRCFSFSTLVCSLSLAPCITFYMAFADALTDARALAVCLSRAVAVLVSIVCV